MRYEPDAPYPELVKTVPHVAFEVDDLERELKGKKVIIEPNSPSPGVTVAFIENHGSPWSFYRSTRLGQGRDNHKLQRGARFSQCGGSSGGFYITYSFLRNLRVGFCTRNRD